MFDKREKLPKLHPTKRMKCVKKLCRRFVFKTVKKKNYQLSKYFVGKHIKSGTPLKLNEWIQQSERSIYGWLALRSWAQEFLP